MSSLSTNIIKRGRRLQNEDELFTQNAWDDTEWTDEMLRDAENRILEQKEASERGLSEELDVSKIEDEVTKNWDDFYKAHGDKFFKDRRWIFSEFPELLEHLRGDSQERPSNIFEVGCGVGNAVVHIINSNQNPNLHIYCCDLSTNAIDILRGRDVFKSNSDRITAFQADVCKDFDSVVSQQVSSESVDFIMMVFTMSAFKPELMKPTIANLSTRLKPGGLILFRDYGRYDLTQLRFKGKSYLRDNYYRRADGTTSYFFTKQTVDDIFTSAGLVQVELKDDNRLLVNRLKGLKMCRCWIQAKYAKKR